MSAEAKGTSCETFLQNWKGSLQYSNRFRMYWQATYLSMLRERTQHAHRAPRSTVKSEARLAEVLLTPEQGCPRGKWRLGRTGELIKGTNHLVRASKVKLSSDNSCVKPINMHLPLEISLLDRTDPPLVYANLPAEKAD